MNIIKNEPTLVIPKAFADAVQGFYEDMLDCGLEDLTYDILEAIIDKEEKIHYVRIRYE